MLPLLILRPKSHLFFDYSSTVNSRGFWQVTQKILTGSEATTLFLQIHFPVPGIVQVGSTCSAVTATQGTASVTATALARNKVESVSADTTGMTVTLQGGNTVKYDAIKAIL